MMKSFIIRRRVLLAHFKAERHVIMASLVCNNARSFSEQQQLQSTHSHSHHSLCVCAAERDAERRRYTTSQRTS